MPALEFPCLIRNKMYIKDERGGKKPTGRRKRKPTPKRATNKKASRYNFGTITSEI